MTRVICLNPSSAFFVLLCVYFSLKCKVKTKNNQKEKFVVAPIRAQAGKLAQAIRACVPQNLRPRAGDCMSPD